MRPKDALAIAASAAGISPRDAESVVATFLVEIARCPACNGSGNFTFLRDVKVTADVPGLDEVPIKAGTSGPCPLCGGTKLDLTHAHWVCFKGDSPEACERAKEAGGATDQAHATCGLVPIPPVTRDSHGNARLREVD